MAEAEPSAPELLSRAIESMPPADRQRVLTWLLSRSLTRGPLGLGQLGFTGLAAGAGPGHGAGTSTAAATQMVVGQAAAADFVENLSTPEADPFLSRAVGAGRRGEHQVVPIRLPAEQHALLREWCSEHGFTMATVVRGLVERFLEERGQLPGRGT